MKICSRCKITKPLEDYGRHKDKGYQGFCKSCNKKYQSEWYKRNAIKVKSDTKMRKHRNIDYLIKHLKTHPCVDCGENDLLVLEFDHLRDKIDDVFELAKRGVSLDTLQIEIEKCQVVCANDHKRRTHKRCQSRRFKATLAPVV